MITTESHRQALADAAAVTSAARSQVDAHEALAAEVRSLKLAAAGGELDELQAADLITKAEQVRVGEIVLPRKQAALRDAQAAELKAALAVLADLQVDAEALVQAADTAAESLMDAVLSPAAREIRCDTGEGFQRDRSRFLAGRTFCGVFEAAALALRIETAQRITFGSSHIPAEAARIVESYPAESSAIRHQVAALAAAAKAAKKQLSAG
jgi:hypothetical protein